MVHYIQPYDKNSPPNIGRAINSAIKQLNPYESDWICLLDHDVMFLRPDSKKQLESIIETTDYDVLGCVTNRLAASTQLVRDMFNEFDIRKHAEVANKMHELNYGVVVETKDILAAFCLCFKYSTYKALNGFFEGVISFDSLFCIEAAHKGFKMGICPGIYLFHAYRLLSDNPKVDVRHLL